MKTPKTNVSKNTDDTLEKQFTCIVCPIGCSLRLKVSNGKIEITGNRCPKGYEYALNEYKCPKRTLTTNVRIINGDHELLSVKTDSPIPKDSIWDVMRIIKSVKVEAPKNVGDVILKNVLNLGANVISTRKVRKTNIT